MSNEITKAGNRGVIDPEKLQNFLFQHSAKKKIIRKKYREVEEDGKKEIKLVPVEVEFEPKNSRLNKDVTPAHFERLSAIAKASDRARFKELIQNDQFEVIKAIQSCEALTIANSETFLPLSWSEADSANTCSIVTLAKYKGKDKARAIVQLILSKFAQRFGTRNQLNENIIKSLAKEILTTYGRFSIADLKFIFGNASLVATKGTYKSRFDFSVDRQQVLQLLEESKESKMIDAELASQDEKIQNFSVEARYRQGPGYQPERALTPEERKREREDFAEKRARTLAMAGQIAAQNEKGDSVDPTNDGE